MEKRTGIWLAGACVMLAGASVYAAPGLPVTKPPVLPVPSWTGPINDAHAVMGQWFIDKNLWDPGTGQNGTEVRPFEFHDNVIDYGGGDLGTFDSSRSIYGKVTSITTHPTNGNITGFTIRARITDDRPALSLWFRGENSHGEWETVAPTNLENPNDPVDDPAYDPFTKQNNDPMRNVKLTVEFAVSDPTHLPEMVSPYRQGENPAYIVAVNHDELAWYCWTPDNPENKFPTGDFYVPTFDFGDIAPGGFVERDLFFTVSDAGILPTETRYSVLTTSLENLWGNGDIFSNRTTDLKIGDWLDNVRFDFGTPYFTDPIKGGNVSVFYIPEPTTLGLLALGGLALLRVRGRRC